MQQGACGPDFERTRQEWGDHAGEINEKITPALVEQARAAGVDMVWVACHIIDELGRAEFISFTLRQREEALEALLGSPLPADSAALREASRVSWAIAGETGDVRARSLALALRQAARDIEIIEPTPEQAQEAARAAERAVSYSGGDPATTKREQEDWLEARLI